SQIGSTLREVPTIVAAALTAPASRRTALEAGGAHVLTLPVVGGRIDLRALMVELARLEHSTVLVEGGAELAAALVRAGLVDRLIFFLAPRLLGGRAAPGPLGGEGFPRME